MSGAMVWPLGVAKDCRSGPTKSRPEPSGAVRTPPGGLRRPERYNDRHIKRENARESGCS